MNRSGDHSAAYRSFPPSAPPAPPDYTEEQEDDTALEISDLSPPLPDYNNRGLQHISYDQVVNWWNALEEHQRRRMQEEGRKIEPIGVLSLRRYYQEFFPREYYPQEVYSKNELSACDYYLLYYLCDEMKLDERYLWLSSNFTSAFVVPPPAYDEFHKQQPPSYEAAIDWWGSLPEEKQAKFKSRQYKPEHILLIRREFSPYYRYYASSYAYNPACLDCYDYYLMSRYSSRFYGAPLFYDDFLFYHSMRATIELGVRGSYQVARLGGKALSFVGQAVVSGMRGAGNLLGTVGGRALSGGNTARLSVSDDNISKNPLAILLGLGIILGVIATAALAVVASLYTGIKAAASVMNLLQGRKVLRSLWRLGCMAVGAYSGVLVGATVGAMTGSVIPGIGTAVGAVIGAIFSAPILAAAGGAVAKYTARLISPNDKWDIQKTQQALQANTVNMNTNEIQRLLSQLKEQKNQHKSRFHPFKGAIVATFHKREKDRYNHFLEGIKRGLDPRVGIRVDQYTRFRWAGDREQIERQNVELPKLKSGLRR